MADSSLVYPKTESRNSGFRSPEETQRTINHLLAELVKVQARNDKLNEVNAGLGGRIADLEADRDALSEWCANLENRLSLLVQLLGCGSGGRAN